MLLLRPVPLLLLLVHAGQLLLLLAQRLLLLVSIYQLLQLVLSDLDILAALLLVRQLVLFQLDSKVNNFFQQFNKFQDSDQFLPSQSLKTLTSIWLRQ
jgi:hypothetical protein